MRKSEINAIGHGVYRSVKTDRVFLTVEWERSFLHSLNHALVRVAVEGDQRNSAPEIKKWRMKSGNVLCPAVRPKPQLGLLVVEGVDFEEVKDRLHFEYPHLNLYTRWMETRNLLTGDILRWDRVSNIGDYDEEGGFHQNRPQVLLTAINGHRINRADGTLLHTDKELAIASDLMQVGFCSWRPEKRRQIIAPISCASPVGREELRAWHRLAQKRKEV